ncbi:MAG: phage tail tube protein [Fervidobacterium sp.]
MAIVGYGGAFYVKPEGATTATKVLEISKWSLDISTDEIETTSFDSDGWKEFLTGLGEWSGSFEGNFNPSDTTGQVALLNAILNKTLSEVELHVNDTVKFSGKVKLSTSIETPVDDKVSVSFDFKGTGKLTVTGLTTTTV